MENSGLMLPLMVLYFITYYLTMLFVVMYWDYVRFKVSPTE